MSHLLDRVSFFTKTKPEEFSDGHGKLVHENRDWERAYRNRWAHDKVVRSTHGVNCTGSCSWKIYVKNGLVTWETQQTNYPRTRPDLPDHEPRGCQRGATYSWYLYSATRLKYPLIRSRLLRIWRSAKEQHSDPVNAWKSIMEDKEKSQEYKKVRGLGGMIRADWDEVNEIIAASNIYTAKTYGPDRVVGFSPIPAMSMVSYAAGSRYLSLIGGTCLSFYDWYCDLPPSSPQTWGEQTDVPESADWYNSSYIMAWGSNVPQTRTPDAHFFTETRYNGTKTIAVTPDFSEVAKLSDEWMSPTQGTDAALAMTMGHVILKEYHLNNKSEYFTSYIKQYTDMSFLVMLEEKQGVLAAGRTLRASDIDDSLGEKNNTEWKPLLIDSTTNKMVVPTGTIGSRWDGSGKWNIENKNAMNGVDIDPKTTLKDDNDEIVSVGFPYFNNQEHEQEIFTSTEHDSILMRNVPIKKFKLSDGSEVKVATVFDLMMANYSVDQGLGGDNVAISFDDNVPYTPAWNEKVTGVPREQIIRIAREFSENADKTQGKSMVILGAAVNHWYHMDMIYRGIINMLMMCGCIGKSGGGWAHYVGQEKLRPQTGWQPLAFGLDWHRPPRHMNGTSFFYNHSSQWRYEKLEVDDILSPLADKKEWGNYSMIDCNVRSEKMGWLPSAPQFEENPLEITKQAERAGMDVKDYIVKQLKSKELKFSCEDPDNPKNFPHNMFIWRSNLLGSSGKGHEYLLKHLLGTQNAVLGNETDKKPSEVKWRDGAEGKVDLFVTLDFRMSTTCLYSDIVLPSATWYEKNDLNTSDMHPFIHPLSKAVDPAWESRSDWDIYKGLAKKFSELCPGHLGKEKDVVALPILHDTPAEMAQATDVKAWFDDECEAIPGKTMPNFIEVERNYPDTYKKFTSLGPLMSKIGNGGKGIAWNTEDEVSLLADLNRVVREEGVSKGLPKIETDIDATEVILSLAPETNGQVAVKAWEALGKITGRDHTHLAKPKEDEKIRFRDVQAQPRKIISSPTWSGLEDEHVSYNAGYTNVHEYIPWRTLTGRQQFYQDHKWMVDFGENLCTYKPPINTKTIAPIINENNDGRSQVVLNWITPHQKWGIHSTYSDNLLMLTLNRGGPVVWISEIDAKKIGVEDNDWIELYNVNGTIVARAVVSQRVPEGMSMMYHAQEKITTTPVAEKSGFRGGIHNSVTRAITKPTHMIGGYVQLSYGFNYYGTVGSNRDEFVVVRKMDKVDWKDEPVTGGQL
ncbi:Respiratory nitrate reductase alpha chain (EC 1.7.99.4) [uncultured Gammaproteobacteria bacterium]|jgi:nitrate reductase alpha subunit|uniref:Respiratory nitrate reductase alpha chain (EC) n=3 Tax=sulfur-oxidizing symbionts TaxID=32036 RepID=A0ACA8ZMU0_9GAMM|nr:MULTISPECIES: nitrate reductase subunit alpha [sulfur-oxidizing symbionts]CAC5863792.1 Respiratory nitrate reductase alpha chain (EC 1.7.99.4) [uncultured Gammaproteobacteria bacterium]CAB5494962.1 Respiratory nitrate reductase alpha chain (EC [Bathymodiolus azoricus thioautotrophic gill symbiont]CAB5506728.1 Respiratory nitrate reductase alpha chain (EC [Bathymodiolus thermophilus thioautotrophic gill symbiont]CAC9430415.1 Respiratory nitrate reductase alpha chain (EC 1.7.99.4) [uncultured 